jgi:hypothetical protein
MRLAGQAACVLAGLLICLALTIGLAGSPPPAPKPSPSGGDDIPFPTWDVPTSDATSPGGHPRVPVTIVPEGVAVLLLTIIWTACRALLSAWLEQVSSWRALVSACRRRSFG